MIATEVKLSGDLFSGLDRLEKHVQEKVLLSGVAAMAKVPYDIARSHIHDVEGLLKSAIYRVYSPEQSSETKKTYRISWNRSKAPHGHLVEFGHMQPYRVIKLKNGEWITLKDQPLPFPKQVPAFPFIRPAYQRINEAIEAGKARMAERMAEL
jgi:hypothetical protein